MGQPLLVSRQVGGGSHVSQDAMEEEASDPAGEGFFRSLWAQMGKGLLQQLPFHDGHPNHCSPAWGWQEQ